MSIQEQIKEVVNTHRGGIVYEGAPSSFRNAASHRVP